MGRLNDRGFQPAFRQPNSKVSGYVCGWRPGRVGGRCAKGTNRTVRFAMARRFPSAVEMAPAGVDGAGRGCWPFVQRLNTRPWSGCFPY